MTLHGTFSVALFAAGFVHSEATLSACLETTMRGAGATVWGLRFVKPVKGWFNNLALCNCNFRLWILIRGSAYA